MRVREAAVGDCAVRHTSATPDPPLPPVFDSLEHLQPVWEVASKFTPERCLRDEVEPAVERADRVGECGELIVAGHRPARPMNPKYVDPVPVDRFAVIDLRSLVGGDPNESLLLALRNDPLVENSLFYVAPVEMVGYGSDVPAERPDRGGDVGMEGRVKQIRVARAPQVPELPAQNGRRHARRSAADGRPVRDPSLARPPPQTPTVCSW